MQSIANRATRNFDIKALRKILSEALPPAVLHEQYEKCGLAPGGLDAATISPAVIVQTLASEFFRSEAVRLRLCEALHEATSAESAQLAQLAEAELRGTVDTDPQRHARFVWSLSTHENPGFQAFGLDLLQRKPVRPVPRPVPVTLPPPSEAVTLPPPSEAVTRASEEEDADRPQTRKSRKLQATLSSLQKEMERLRHEKQRSRSELDELRLENENLRRRLEHSEGVDELRARLEQVGKEKEHVIYELNRKSHELHQLQKKYEIFNRLDTEVLVLRSKVAKILNDAIVERKRFAEQLAAITDANMRSLQFYRGQKDKNLGPAERTSGLLRVGVFVDVQNMFYAARNKFNGRLDYQALLKTVVRGRKLAKANAYIIQTPDIDQSNFILLLEHCGYEVHSKYLRTRYDGSAKGDWDMEIAIDIISMIGQLDVVILVSGDGDFVALVKMVQRHGLEVEVHSFEHNTAVDLREATDRFYPINEDLILH
jgi:uncharacterized LabA/DUF88 family protein/regulator of replication initiation timing